ncbi:MAG: Flp pilus assembly protein CpaB [Deltaproteobacteria bacterium]|nr:Flp pilus assembly protein CpaB [Deltaproteobacteria bacterium]
MLKARFALIVLLVCVVAIAIFGGAWLYLRPKPVAPAPRAAPPPKPLPVVLTASTDLAVGSLITANDVIWSPLKNGVILSAHMLKGKTQPESVVGAVVRRSVYKGMPLTWSSIVRPGQYGFLAAALRRDHRAVTILVNRATSQAGLIYPGDRVDVILTVEVPDAQTRKTNTFTGTILENIRVVAVNRQVESSVGSSQGQGGRKPSRSGASTVTLEVMPSEAERLVLATSKGDISLAMRSLTDGARRDQRTPTGLENLLALPATEIKPEETPSTPTPVAAPIPVPVPKEPSPVRVQILRGSAREEVTLKK